MKKEDKLSYEDLKVLANQQQEQILMLKKQLERASIEYNRAMEIVMGKRLEMLFKVLEHKDLFDTYFVNDAVATIQEMLRTPATSEDSDVKSEE